MPKAKKVGNHPPSVVFYCIACKERHAVPYTKQRPPPAIPVLWYFDENFECPTIEPSLRVFNHDGKTTKCHVVITAGILNYQGDQPGEYCGRSVPMQDLTENV